MDLYSQVFLDHAKNPRNTGKLAKATHTGSMENNSCGDSTKVQLKIKNEKLKMISHRTKGCMVAVFSASVLSEKLVGKSVKEVVEMSPQDLTKLLGVELTMSRLKCAMLPLIAVQKALRSN